MSEITVSHKGHTLRVVQDSDTSSPLEEFDLRTKVFIPQGNRYFTGSDGAVDPTTMDPQDVALLVPLYGYVHGGRTAGTAPYSCPWDSGQIGFAYIEASHPECAGKSVEELREIIDGEVAIWRQWMEGDVHCYEVTTESGEYVDSLSGIYGDPLESFRDHCGLPEDVVEGLAAAAEAARTRGFAMPAPARRGSMSR